MEFDATHNQKKTIYQMDERQQNRREEERLPWSRGRDVGILSTEQIGVTPEVPDTGLNSWSCDHFTASG
jgi:hypothetical protein